MTVWVFLVLGIQKLFIGKNNNLSISIFASTILTLVSASYFYGRFQIHNTSTNPVNHVLYLDNGEQIETNKNLLYLGKVTGYYFLFDDSVNSTIILPSDRVKKDVLKNGIRK